MSKPNTRKIRFFRIHQKLDKASVLSIYMQKSGLYLQLDVKYSYINGMYLSNNQFVTISDKKQFQEMTKIVISYRIACMGGIHLIIGPDWNETVDFKMLIGYKKASTEMEEDYLMGSVEALSKENW